jgi:apolipoprotein N-acyltransferase
MDSKPDSKTMLGALVACLASGALFYFGTGLHPVWFLTWAAAFPVLWIAPHISPVRSFAVALMASVLGGLNMWRYFLSSLRAPLAITLWAILSTGVVFGSCVLIFRRQVRRGETWKAALAFSCAWMTFEYLLALFSPHSTYGSLAYTQMDFLPILQLASITGLHGISFLLFLAPATLALLTSSGIKPQKTFVLMTGAAFIGVLLFGTLRLHKTSKPAPQVRVGLIASDLPQNLIAENHDDAVRLMREYAAQVDHLAADGAQVVVIPEKTAVVLESYLPEIDSLLQETAARNQVDIIVGFVDVQPRSKWNEARVYSRDGQVIASYAKHHMLPLYESSFTVGTERTLLTRSSGTWGITICKDMDFPQLSRKYANDGAGLLLVPAWDFVADGWLHGRMAVMRGVEDGFSIARVPKQGILTVTDDKGRVLAERVSANSAFTVLVADVPVSNQRTFYSMAGNWFPRLGIVILCMVVLIGNRNEHITRRAEPGSNSSPHVHVKKAPAFQS